MIMLYRVKLATPLTTKIYYAWINPNKNKKEIEKEELEKVIDTLFRHHEGISRNATRLNNLISNLLDVARIDSHQKNMVMMNRENLLKQFVEQYKKDDKNKRILGDLWRNFKIIISPIIVSAETSAATSMATTAVERIGNGLGLS